MIAHMIFLDEDRESEEKPQFDTLMERALKTRTIIISGEINKQLAERSVRQLLLLEAEDAEKPILVLIDSPGGDVDAGFAIYDMIRFVSPKVYLLGIGLVASAAALILLTGAKGERVGLPNSRYLIHQPLTGLQGVATDLEIHAKEIEKTKEKLNLIMAEAIGKPIETIQKDTDRDYWMNATEALKYGLISRIVKTRSELNM